MELEKLHQQAVAFARRALQESRQVHPTFLALTQDDKLLLIATPDFAGDRDRHHYYLRKYFKEHAVVAYAVCSEVWMARYAPDALPQRMTDGRLIDTGVPPSQNPARTEAVMISTVGRDQVIAQVFHIDRSGTRPALGTAIMHTTSPATLENQVGVAALLPSRGETATREDASGSLIGQALQAASQRPARFKARGPYPFDPSRN